MKDKLTVAQWGEVFKEINFAVVEPAKDWEDLCRRLFEFAKVKCSSDIQSEKK